MIRLCTSNISLCCVHMPLWFCHYTDHYFLFIFPFSTCTRITALKGTATLIISMFFQKELYKPWILIQVSSKSVEKWASYGHLKNSIWPTFSRHFEYLISFQNCFNCLIFSYHYYHILCFSADMQLYTYRKISLKINAINPLVCLLF